YEGFLISYNGSQVYDVKTKQILFNQAISINLTKDLVNHLTNVEVVSMVDQDEYMLVNDALFDIKSDGRAVYMNVVHYEVRGGRFKGCEVDDLSKEIKKPVNKILVAGNPDYLQKHHQAMSAPFKKSITAAFSAPFYYEFTNQGIDKARALDEILLKLG